MKKKRKRDKEADIAQRNASTPTQIETGYCSVVAAGYSVQLSYYILTLPYPAAHLHMGIQYHGDRCKHPGSVGDRDSRARSPVRCTQFAGSELRERTLSFPVWYVPRITCASRVSHFHEEVRHHFDWLMRQCLIKVCHFL